MCRWYTISPLEDRLESGKSINNICVIGAGTMGSGIAAHFANLGFRVILLDATPASVRAAFDRAKSIRPPHFFTPHVGDRIQLGSTEQNLDWIAEADWVVEAVVEKPKVKRAIYRLIEPHLREDAFVSTNTSGLEIALLNEGQSESFRRRFLGTHFFNPPRYLKLLELIPTSETHPDVVAQMVGFLEQHAARRVVVAKDTPGFIANRFGMWAMYQAIHATEKLGLTIETVDAITGAFLGRPRSGSFRLNDLVGLDIMADIASNLVERCGHDPMIGTLRTPVSMQWLLEHGWIGEKSKQGYYRKEGKEFLSFDLAKRHYRERIEPQLPALTELGKLPLGQRVREALKGEDEVGAFLREYLVPTLRYAESIREEIAHSVLDIDRVMRWGFGWEMGPFELLDAIGTSAKPYYHNHAVLNASRGYTPIKEDPQFAKLTDFPVVEQAVTFNVRDLGDGIHGVSLTTKMGVISPLLVQELTSLLKRGEIKRLILGGEAKSFSAGFDLRFFLDRIEAGDFDGVNQALVELQQLGELLESIPSVAAIYGYCLGAGFELAASCQTIVADAESQIGLPELRVGLLPGGRGTTLMRLTNQATPERLVDAFSTLAQSQIAPNADTARLLGYLRGQDVTSYHPDRLIATAKEALSASVPPRPEWTAPTSTLPGMIDNEISRLRSSDTITDYDASLSLALKSIFCKSTSYDEALMAERWQFLELCHHPHSVARIRHMVETNKPLRN